MVQKYYLLVYFYGYFSLKVNFILTRPKEYIKRDVIQTPVPVFMKLYHVKILQAAWWRDSTEVLSSKLTASCDDTFEHPIRSDHTSKAKLRVPYLFTYQEQSYRCHMMTKMNVSAGCINILGGIKSPLTCLLIKSPLTNQKPGFDVKRRVNVKLNVANQSRRKNNNNVNQ